MLSYTIKNETYKDKEILIPFEIHEIRPLLSPIFSLQKILLMTRGISEMVERNHPHIETVKQVLSGVIGITDTVEFSIHSQIQQIHTNYSHLAMDDAFRYTLLESIFSYPSPFSLDTTLGDISQLTIRDNYWDIKYPFFLTQSPAFFFDFRKIIEFNYSPDILHEYAIGFLRELEFRETEAGSDLTKILDDLIYQVNENINDYLGE